ncbi:EAL domain-containing protein [Caballeronia sp. LZ035]|uniref:bifunctional diguanylate cyclase/phosphodiesterase n=1 Tax=Caballeronia sp. LZ035 TaxID=3038568 RepID=UPI00285BAE0A|nr:EAL domain-containing protein [Caballeronia sp. LZ035]MDR5763288.1 EAL domain-containing protein [Caballeronia sp. LZ035]
MIFDIDKLGSVQSLDESDAAHEAHDSPPPETDGGAPDPRAARARIRMRRLLEAYVLIPVFAGFLLAVIWIVMLQFVHTQREAAQDAAAELVRELADTYEAQLARNLSTIDQTLKTVQFAYKSNGATSLRRLNEQGLLPSAMVFRIAIADAKGKLTATNRSGMPLNVAAEPWFAAQHERQDDARAPYMSRAVTGERGTTPEITFSRRLRDANGQFGGAVMLSLDPGYLTSNYDTVRMGKSGLLAVLGMDGIARAQQIGEALSWGAHFSEGALGRLHHQSSAMATVHPWDQGESRYTTLRELHAYSLIALVGLDEDEQLAEFHSRRRAAYVWTTILSVAVVSIAWLLSRSSWQLAVSRRRERRAQQTYYAASEASIDAFLVFRGERNALDEITGFVLTATNGRGVEILGRPREQLIGSTLEQALVGAQEDGIFDEFVVVAKTSRVREQEWQQRRADGETRWLHRQVVPVEEGVVAIVRDVSARKRNEARRQEQSRILEMIAKSVPLEEVLVRVVDVLEAQIQRAHGAVLLRDETSNWLRVGAAPSLSERYREVVGQSCIDADALLSGKAIYTRQSVCVIDAARDERLSHDLMRSGLGGVRSCWSYPVLSHDGSALGAITLYLQDGHYPSEAEAQAIALATRIAGIAIQRSQAEERIRHMANHDALTGLPNRTLLSDRLKQMLLQAERYGRGVSVVFIDLDNFKLINDSLGHRAGDDLLRTVAARMVQSVRSTDTVVRLGGDEFVIVLLEDNQSGAGVTAMVERLRHEILQPAELQGQSYQVSCSMGVASYPNDGRDADTLLMNADAAMYHAKEMGRNNWQAYTADMNQKVHARLRYQEQLRHALAHGEFRLVYQPQVDLETHCVFGVETLLRWEHPVEGTISPATFIPIAEETGLILPIGDWVLHAACAQNKAWQDEGLPPITVAVNVSARQFLQKGLAERVQHALDESGLDAQYLELEITESVIMQDLEGAIATMCRLQEMGVKLSIDDFGTGYSSLSALKHFPIARLKIDQSFVRELPGGVDDRAIVMAVISLGRQLDLKVIAEGVESEQQLDFLRENACSEIQGYRYSRPLAPDALRTLLQQPFMWPREVA